MRTPLRRALLGGVAVLCAAASACTPSHDVRLEDVHDRGDREALAQAARLAEKKVESREARTGLVALDAQDLFEPSTTYLGFRRGAFLRAHMYEFIELFAPHLTRELVNTVLQTRSRGALRSLFVDMRLPVL